MVRRRLSFASWLVQLFNPPPLSSLSLWQKIARIGAVSLTLVAVCILTALTGASGIFMIDRCRLEVSNSAELLQGLEIVVASLVVNLICVAVLLEIRKADLRLHLHSSDGPGLH